MTISLISVLIASHRSVMSCTAPPIPPEIRDGKKMKGRNTCNQFKYKSSIIYKNPPTLKNSFIAFSASRNLIEPFVLRHTAKSKA